LKNLACKCQKTLNFWLHKGLGSYSSNARYTNEDRIQNCHPSSVLVDGKKHQVFCTTMIITKDSIQILIHQQCWWMVRSIKFCTTMIITKDSIQILIHQQCWWMVRSIKFCTTTIIIDALPSHGVKPTWGFHKVKLRKVKTW